jgi:Tfp pilus assembly protein PilN
MKLPLKKATVALAPNWHPDFRDVQTLPDLKVVRTSFFVNVLCITLAAAAVLFTAYRNYIAFTVRSDIALSEERMAGTRSQNAKLLAMSREFSEAAAKFEEADKFLEGRVIASQILIALSQSLPSAMDFTSVALDGQVVTLRGTIRGASDTGSTRLSSYLDILRNDPVLGPQFPDVSLTSMLRDPRTQGLSFEIQMKPAAAAGKANAKS